MCDPRVSGLMATAGAKIGIKKHKVGKDPNNLTELVGPCDVEVHVLPDGRFSLPLLLSHRNISLLQAISVSSIAATVPSGRFYVLDSARIFPPCRPDDYHRGLLIPAGPREILKPLDIDTENTHKAVCDVLAAPQVHRSLKSGLFAMFSSLGC